MSLTRTIEQVLSEYAPADNPYLTALRDGEFARDDFIETQVQFYYAVVFFSRPMAVLAAKIPSAATRTEILRNVWEEHGEGSAASRHGVTFLELMRRLAGLDKQAVEARALWPELRAFNTTLIGCCTLDDWEVGASCLGIIERMFVDYSSRIGQSIVERKWLPQDRVVHYATHEVLDIRHSDDFFATLEPVWHKDADKRYLIEQGLRLGAYTFDKLYRDLHRARTRRALAPVTQPQPHVYDE